MRLRIRRSARPHFEGEANEDFGRPRAVTTTGAMAHGFISLPTRGREIKDVAV